MVSRDTPSDFRLRMTARPTRASVLRCLIPASALLTLSFAICCGLIAEPIVKILKDNGFTNDDVALVVPLSV